MSDTPSKPASLAGDLAAVNVRERGTVYVVIESEWKSGDVGGSLLLDSGEVKWSHLSSGRAWLQRDLTNGFTDRRTELERLYPDGYDVVVVDRDGQIPDDVMARNEAWAAAKASPNDGADDG